MKDILVYIFLLSISLFVCSLLPRKRKKIFKQLRLIAMTFSIIVFVCILLLSFDFTHSLTHLFNSSKDIPIVSNISLDQIPKYTDSAYITINSNHPYFKESDLTSTSYENYSSLDSLGRATLAMACVGKDLMPTTERGSIGSIKPTGWQTVKYDTVDGKYLYNRCHLIGYQLTGENANNKNLITCTRYMNVTGMLPFENMITDYIKETNHHVLYRVTPIYEGNNLLASGALLEAQSIEDNGAGIKFNVYVYNVEPGIKINYADGTSSKEN